MLESLKIIRNGGKTKGTFSDSEMERRLAALRSMMAAEGMDAALFTSYHNINYFSDFLYCSFGRLYGLVVTQSEDNTKRPFAGELADADGQTIDIKLLLQRRP